MSEQGRTHYNSNDYILVCPECEPFAQIDFKDRLLVDPEYLVICTFRERCEYVGHARLHMTPSEENEKGGK